MAVAIFSFKTSNKRLPIFIEWSQFPLGRRTWKHFPYNNFLNTFLNFVVCETVHSRIGRRFKYWYTRIYVHIRQEVQVMYTRNEFNVLLHVFR
jgi:hypothetical protein